MGGFYFPMWNVVWFGSQTSTEQIWLLQRPFLSFLAKVQIKSLWRIVFMVNIGANVGLEIQVSTAEKFPDYDSVLLLMDLIAFFCYICIYS